MSGGSNGGGGGIAATTGVAGTSSRVGVATTLKLSQLQNLCKRDPTGYRDDYDAQIRRLESELGILALQQGGGTSGALPGTSSHSTKSAAASSSSSSSSSSHNKRLEELIQFAAAVSSSSYRGSESDRIASLFTGVLVGRSPLSTTTATASSVPYVLPPPSPSASVSSSASHNVAIAAMPAAALRLPKDVRKSLVSALILMRNKGVVEPLRLLELFFRIMAVVPDKSLREMLHRHVVNDIRNINKKGKRDDKVNRSIQTFFHRVVSSHGQSSSSTVADDEESATDVAAKRATDMVCELYRRRVWTDSRTVAIAATAVMSHNATVMSRALRFFLNIEEKMAHDLKQQQEEDYESKNRIDYHAHSRKTSSRQRHVQRQLKRRKKALLEKQGNNGDNADWMDAACNPDNSDRGVEASKKLYPAIELLRDPQGLAEAVLKRLKASSSSYKYETKLLMMNFVTRLVGNHGLLVLPLYSFLTKYLSGGHQRDVTAVLAYAVQACHEGVPPDEVHGLLKTIAHNFITERCSEEQMAVGINAARAICSRVPSVMSAEEDDEDGDDDGGGGGGGGGNRRQVAMDIEAFARDLAAFANHRDRSVSIAGKGWQNFVRETNPGLLQGKHRGLRGTALKRAGARPPRYGESRTAMGVEGADLLVEYESKKKAAAAAARRHRKKPGEKDSGVGEDAGEWDEKEEEMVDEAAELESSDDDDESAPDLILLDGDRKQDSASADDSKDKSGSAKDDAQESADKEEQVVDVSKMTSEERDRLKQRVSSTRIFTASDFAKMRKLIERERRAKLDPREAARRKRALARSGRDFENLSGDDEDDDASGASDGDGDGGNYNDESSDGDDDDEQVRIAGAVNPGDIMAHAKKKRQSKAEKLQRVIAGRSDFETKQRDGGSTNVEKKRKKNFLMSKFSRETRSKGKGKGSLHKKRKQKRTQFTHEAKKRRRKL